MKKNTHEEIKQIIQFTPVRYYDVIYKKEFEYKEQAERFIKSHKNQSCFDLGFKYPCLWIVTKTKLSKKQMWI